jgi:hypothetical protein
MPAASLCVARAAASAALANPSPFAVTLALRGLSVPAVARAILQADGGRIPPREASAAEDGSRWRVRLERDGSVVVWSPPLAGATELGRLGAVVRALRAKGLWLTTPARSRRISTSATRRGARAPGGRRRQGSRAPPVPQEREVADSELPKPPDGGWVVGTASHARSARPRAGSTPMPPAQGRAPWHRSDRARACGAALGRGPRACADRAGLVERLRHRCRELCQGGKNGHRAWRRGLTLTQLRDLSAIEPAKIEASTCRCRAHALPVRGCSWSLLVASMALRRSRPVAG